MCNSYGYEMTAPIRLFIRGAGPDACSYKRRSDCGLDRDYRQTVCAFDFVPFFYKLAGFHNPRH